MNDRARSTGFSLKDQLFNETKIRFLADLLDGVAPGFDPERFRADVMARLLDLELKARIDWIAEVLAGHLPKAFSEAAEVIRKALPPPLDPTLTDDDFGDFIFAPYGAFVAAHGKGHLDIALATLREITMRFSMEDAIRTFLEAEPERTLDTMKDWAQDENYHVRRLVSEGTRPRLPWSVRLDLPEERVMALLDQLHADPTRYVTRSVANHLNDIAKDAPERVVEALGRWKSAGRQEAAELDWLTRHALRTMIKAGHPGALEMLGYGPNPDATVTLDLLTPEVRIGEALSFAVQAETESKAALLIDYAIDFVKANGTTAPKVFKLKTLSVTAGKPQTFQKTHRLMGNATTYTLYPGTHRVTLQINGRPGPSATFELV